MKDKGLAQRFGYHEHQARIDSLLDELVKAKAELAICKELSAPDLFEVEIQGKMMEQCVAALTATNARLSDLSKYVQGCRTRGGMPSVWELEILIHGTVRGPAL